MDNSKRIPTVAIISVARSGTNYFVSTLNKFNRAAAYFELFGDRGVFGILNHPTVAERLSAIIERPVETADDPELVRVFRDRPALHLSLLNHCAAQTGYDWMSYKVFPDQVDIHKLKHSLLQDSTKVLFLTRSRLETYISLQKALSFGKWKNIETSDLRPAIDVDAFLSWAKHQTGWYTMLYAHVRSNDVPFEIVDYETQINVPQAELLRTCQGLLKRFGIDADYPEDEAHKAVVTKQDKTKDPFDRIANGPQTRDQLVAKGQLEYALSAPLAEGNLVLAATS